MEKSVTSRSNCLQRMLPSNILFTLRSTARQKFFTSDSTVTTPFLTSMKLIWLLFLYRNLLAARTYYMLPTSCDDNISDFLCFRFNEPVDLSKRILQFDLLPAIYFNLVELSNISQQNNVRFPMAFIIKTIASMIETFTPAITGRRISLHVKR